MAEQAAQYKCDVCGATFKDADALTKHKVIHESDDTGSNEPSIREPVKAHTGPVNHFSGTDATTLGATLASKSPFSAFFLFLGRRRRGLGSLKLVTTTGFSCSEQMDWFAITLLDELVKTLGSSELMDEQVDDRWGADNGGIHPVSN
jgi:hypothetical protein